MGAEITVLVCDDEPDAQEYVKAILETRDFKVITAKDGEEGIQKAISEKPQLIILDVQMPKKDGFATFYELKQNEQSKDIPVIMLTGIGTKIGMKFSKEDMGAFMNTEPDAYVEKPINPDELLKTVDRVLAK